MHRLAYCLTRKGPRHTCTSGTQLERRGAVRLAKPDLGATEARARPTFSIESLTTEPDTLDVALLTVRAQIFNAEFLTRSGATTYLASSLPPLLTDREHPRLL